ncbi:MAG: peptidylprolyl isomerase [Candidatus Delongbacteria bacterium]|jgi:parvulin-like peptidyl-prolyl isomerase|nr:peptidylprolyl isomerase [Candidatus Delongbacteria bacterium]
MNDQVLIKVNGEDICEADVAIRLKNKGDYKKCLIELIELTAMRQFAKDHGVVISEQELQEYSDKKRQEQKLYSVSDTNKYLSGLGVNIDQWAEHLENELLENKAKEKLFDEKAVEEYYEMNKLMYSTLSLNKIVVEDKDSAEEIITQIKEGEDFEELARDNSIDKATSEKGGYTGIIKRGILSPDIENRLFASEKGSVAGPFKENGRYVVYRVNDIVLEKLDDKLKNDIIEGMYSFWKQNVIASSKIETV